MFDISKYRYCSVCRNIDVPKYRDIDIAVYVNIGTLYVDDR